MFYSSGNCVTSWSTLSVDWGWGVPIIFKGMYTYLWWLSHMIKGSFLCIRLLFLSYLYYTNFREGNKIQLWVKSFAIFWQCKAPFSSTWCTDIVLVMNLYRLWDAEFIWYSLYGLEHSLEIHSLSSAWPYWISWAVYLLYSNQVHRHFSCYKWFWLLLWHNSPIWTCEA